MELYYFPSINLTILFIDTYVADIFNIEKSLLEFILFCIPAVFYDLLSALACNAVLSPRRGKK
jgi:hypothetical protein